MPTSDTTTEAASLLLRSSRWSVSAVMDLLEIGDLEFREMLRTSAPLAEIVRRRQADEGHSEVYDRQCRVCGELYATATFRTHCGTPACRSIDQLYRR